MEVCGKYDSGIFWYVNNADEREREVLQIKNGEPLFFMWKLDRSRNISIIDMSVVSIGLEKGGDYD